MAETKINYAIVRQERSGKGASLTVFDGVSDADEANVLAGLVGHFYVLKHASDDFKAGDVIVADVVDARAWLKEQGRLGEFDARVKSLQDERAERQRRERERRAREQAERAEAERQAKVKAKFEQLRAEREAKELAKLKVEAEAAIDAELKAAG